MASRWTAAIACVGLLAACGPTWPGAVTSLAVPRTHPVRSVDVFPLDLQLWAAPKVDGDQARRSAEVGIMQTALQTLASNNVGTTVVDWNGDAKAGNVMAKDDLLATIDSLAGYGEQATESPHQLPIPYLPARLGTTTGSDATLYIGGWAYVKYEEPSHVGEQIAEGVLIAVAIIAVIGIIAMVSKSHGGGSHSGGGGSSSFGGSGGHVAVSAGRATSAASGGSLTHVGHDLGRGAVHVRGAQGSPGIDPGDIALNTLDAFGHLAIESTRPDWSLVQPHDGDSQMYLEMTLVDNSTGLVLWHARQKFPAGANHPDQVARVTRMLLASMPR